MTKKRIADIKETYFIQQTMYVLNMNIAQLLYRKCARSTDGNNN